MYSKEWSDNNKVPFQTCTRHPLYREYLPHGHEYIGDFPSYPLKCVVFFLLFFPCHTHDFLHNTLFLRSANRSVGNLVHHFVPYAITSCSTIKTPYHIMWRIIMRQHSPLAACLYDIQHYLYQ